MTRKFSLSVAVCASALLATAACGSSSSSKTAAAAGSVGSGSGATGAATAGATGPGVAAPTGTPITIGVQAPMNGPAAYPQTGYGAEAAALYVNQKLGGINGHPLKVDICAGDDSPETAISCANGFVKNNRPVVYDSYDPSFGSLVPILTSAKIPIVGMLGGQGVADVLPNPEAYYFSGPLQTSALGSLTIIAKTGAKKVSLAVTEAPSSHAYVDALIQPIAKSLGLTVSVSYIATTNLNYTTLAATELASKPDLAGVIALPEAGCTGLVKALRAQGFTGKIFAGSCSQFISAVGAQAAGAIVQPRLWVPASSKWAPASVQAQLADFATYMTKAGYGDQQSARSEYSFAGIIDLAKIMSGITGEITPSSIATAMSQVKDFDSFAGPSITCDGKQWPGAPAACSHAGIFFEVQADGSLKPTGGDGFIQLDPSVIKS